MLKEKLYHLIRYTVAFIWLINGFYCKVLNQVPRHELIVKSILGSEYSDILTILIGCSEITMAVWIVSGIKTKLNVWTQVLVIALMNVLEIALVPDLLLWGKINGCFAIMLIGVILWNEYKIKPKKTSGLL